MKSSDSLSEAKIIFFHILCSMILGIIIGITWAFSVCHESFAEVSFVNRLAFVIVFLSFIIFPNPPFKKEHD